MRTTASCSIQTGNVNRSHAIDVKSTRMVITKRRFYYWYLDINCFPWADDTTSFSFVDTFLYQYGFVAVLNYIDRFLK